MSEIRFSYHPEKKILLVSYCGECHADTIAKQGKKLPFDSWIRGLIIDNKIYLRVYYPFEDINERQSEYILEKSFNLLFDNKKAIIQALKHVNIKTPSKLAYNINNSDLKGIAINI